MITKPIVRTPEFFRGRLAALAHNAALLHERAERGEPMTARDVAIAAEYNQAYIDILTEIEESIVAR
jgi:hypothetical protein